MFRRIITAVAVAASAQAWAQIHDDSCTTGNVGRVRAAILDKPIVHFGNFGSSDLTVSTKLTGADKERFLFLMRKGVSYLHAFHYINAARAFNMAAKLEPHPMAYGLLVLALNQIDPGGPAVSAAGIRASAATFVLTSEERAFLNFAVNGFNGVLYTGEVKQKDLLALLAWKAYDRQVLKELLPNEGALHYMTHVYEPSAMIPDAEKVARLYAEAAADSPHAQHMYGHILPQLGDWEGALVYFKKAHELHLKEFQTEGYTAQEDWHFAHNLDLMLAAMIYLNKIDEAQSLNQYLCQYERDSSCQAATALNIVSGRYSDAEKILVTNYKDYLEYPVVMNLRVLAALGAKDKAKAGELIGRLRSNTYWNSGQLLYARVADTLLNGTPDEDGQIKLLEASLKRPGFDAWSSGVQQSRALARVLQDNGRADLAEKVKRIAIAAHGSQK